MPVDTHKSALRGAQPLAPDFSLRTSAYRWIGTSLALEIDRGRRFVARSRARESQLGKVSASWSFQSGALRRTAAAAQQERARDFALHLHVPLDWNVPSTGEQSQAQICGAIASTLISPGEGFAPVGPAGPVHCVVALVQLSENESDFSRRTTTFLSTGGVAAVGRGRTCGLEARSWG